MARLNLVVKIAKNILKKAEESNSDIYLCLLDYRNTCKPYQPSPAELMYSRKLNSLLPVSKSSLSPKISKPNIQILKKRKQTIKKYYDKKGKELPELKVCDNIYFKKTIDSYWTPGKVVAKNNIPRSYVLSDDRDCKFVRNRKIIRIDFKKKENDEVTETPSLSQSITPKSSVKCSELGTKSNSKSSLSKQSDNNSNVSTSLSKSQSSHIDSPKSGRTMPEENVYKRFDGYLSSRGRIIRNPRRLTYD